MAGCEYESRYLTGEQVAHLGQSVEGEIDLRALDEVLDLCQEGFELAVKYFDLDWDKIPELKIYMEGIDVDVGLTYSTDPPQIGMSADMLRGISVWVREGVPIRDLASRWPFGNDLLFNLEYRIRTGAIEEVVHHMQHVGHEAVTESMPSREQVAELSMLGRALSSYEVEARRIVDEILAGAGIVPFWQEANETLQAGYPERYGLPVEEQLRIEQAARVRARR